MSFLERIRVCSVFERSNYLPFCVGENRVGLITQTFADHLNSFPDVFNVGPGRVDLVASLDTIGARTAAVESVLRELLRQGIINGWRDEPYSVTVYPEAPPVFLMERAAVPLFGVYGTGIHVNGYVGQGADMRMWIGKRSLRKPTAPGKLDQIVAGGRSANYSIHETMLKEGEEEASIPEHLMMKALAVSAISYCTAREEGLRRDVLYIFDVELPKHFVPRNTDGEIDEFYLWPIAQVIDTVRSTDHFKFNCALVVIDFLIRHGFIGHGEPDYLHLIKGLHAF